MTDEPASSVVFDRAADYYDRTRGYPAGVGERVAALFAQAGGLHAGSRVLELGVGTGRIALPLAARVGQVVGIDRSRPMLARLQLKRSGEAVLPLLADLSALPFASGAFDAIIAVHVFHLVPQWQDALRALSRVMAPGARLLVGEDGRVLKELWDAVYETVPKLEAFGPRLDQQDYPLQAGFRAAGEPLVLSFPQTIELATFLREIEERVWSITWRMSDELHARTVAAMRAEVLARYGRLETAIEVERRFTVRAYTPE